uniref:Uncharacterized protein n=1 Tax=Meloidogyne hapla TaxID=6305 RepID=A0A1I8B837_MELHA
MAEESIYMDFPPRDAGREFAEGQEVPLKQRHFVDQCEFARQVVVLIAQTMVDLVPIRENDRQDDREDSNHHTHKLPKTKKAATREFLLQ